MSNLSNSSIWRLRPGADRRFRAGHPWIYSNELTASPKGIEPGAMIELRDAKGEFLARGYGNPHSLIAFRAVSRAVEVTQPASESELTQALRRASQIRDYAGLAKYSHRWVFGESDRLPGLVIDRYKLAQPHLGAEVIVVQAHTAGAQKMLPEALAAIRALTGPRTAIVSRNDLAVRKLEGLLEEAPRLIQPFTGADAKIELRDAKVLVASVTAGTPPLVFATDLLEGQKTGLFLDQFGNIRLAAEQLGGLKPAQGQSKEKTIRILDLCCYVGQWGAQLAGVYRRAGYQVEVVAVDASEKALAFAKRNIEAQGAKCETLKGDVLKDLAKLADARFDLVIADPPALIKNRKDVGPGAHAYLQLNTQAMRLVRKGGGIVSCSCSALLEDEVFAQALSKAAARNRLDVRWTGRGAPAPDHPMLTEFPEGRYLKAWIGVVSC